jgi:hypothetical protein
MNLTDELRKLADLRQQGALTEQEFVDAKRKLLASAPEAPVKPGAAAPSASWPEGVGELIGKRYWSSRWSSGNLFFRDSLVLAEEGIIFRKGAMFGSSEENINYKAIASLKVSHRLFLADLSVETTGGSQPIFINGLWKSDAKEVQTAIRALGSRI